nr:MAG TPA: hypothetical protein [Caudoviricetes sp.]
MKRYRDIYPTIYDYENLYEAYRSARKNKTQRSEVMAFTRSLEENLIELQNELVWRTYRVGRYREFYVNDPKKRLIMALPFRDRVIQWAIYRQINYLLDKRYISTSYACRLGGGTQKAIHQLQQYIRHTPGRVYVLKLDVSKYFYRIDHGVLLGILRRIFKDSDLLELLRRIIDDDQGGGLFGIDIDTGEREPGVGMPIGNLTSQMFANLYLNEADQFAKHGLHAKKYIRYMDDMVIVSHDKAYLRYCWHAMDDFLTSHLKLRLNQKSTIQTAKDGIDFCGYRIWRDHIRLRKKAALKMKHRLRYLRKAYACGEIDLRTVAASLTSYFGLLSHCDSYELRRSVLKDLVLVRCRKEVDYE